MYGGRKKPKKSKIENQLGDKIIKTFKDGIFRNIKNLFEQEDGDYFKSVRVVNFYGTIILIMKGKVIKIKSYQLKNTLMKLHHT